MLELDNIYNMEEWRPAYGYEDVLEVSSLGRARRKAHSFVRKDGRTCRVQSVILTPSYTKTGYVLINAKGGHYEQLHRLVALTFIQKVKGKNEVNHIDEDKSNNSVENLEWVSHKENSNHGTRNARISSTLHKTHKRKKSVKRSDGLIFLSIHDAANAINGSAGNILKNIQGKIKSAYGYRWSYV